MTVTALSVRAGAMAWEASAKAMPYFAGWPMVAMSPTSGRAPPIFVSTSRRARPMQALARLPGPRQLVPAFMPSASAMGPRTSTAAVGVPVVVWMPSRLNFSSNVASAASRTTGNSAGRQPAITQQ